jgi:hypothetical protein
LVKDPPTTWGGIIPNWQLKALVAYLKTLK